MQMYMVYCLKTVLTTGLVLLFSTFCGAQIPGDCVKGEFLVMFNYGVNAKEVVGTFNKMHGPEVKLEIQEELSSVLNIYLIKQLGAEDALVLKKILSTRGVSVAQYNHYVENRSFTPDDSLFAVQWNMENTGQNGGTVNADIDAPEAWQISAGGLTSTGDTIVVAVIDGGCQLTHNDLNIWKNYGEIPSNGNDDDGNGYVDDVYGWNALNNTATVGLDNHGTHCAGIVGAKGNNHIGVAGVNLNVKVMAVVGSSSTESVVIKAYNYVLKQRRMYNTTGGAKGAFIVSANSSFGVDYGNPSSYPLWCSMYDSMGVEGILNIAATTNSNLNVDNVGDIPTTCTSNFLITVTNTTRADKKNSSCGYGPISIDLGAPGTTITSTVQTNNYSSMTGTSMASPHVAGAIGLMVSALSPALVNLYKTQPDSVALLLKNWLLCGTNPLTDLSGKTLTGGRLNLYNAVYNAFNESSCTVGSKDEQKALTNNLINVFPVPAVNSVYVQYSSSSSQVSFEVYDALGKLLLVKQKASGYSGLHQQILNVDELSAGIYFLKMVGDTESVTKRFCISK